MRSIGIRRARRPGTFEDDMVTPPNDPLGILRALFVLLACSSAAAASPGFGLTIAPFTGAWPELTASVSVPFATYESAEGPIVFAARADATAPLNFAGLSSLGLAATGTFTSHDMFQPYFGAGATLGWQGDAPTRSLYVTPTLLAGLQLPLNEVWSVRVEGSAAPLVGLYSFGIGFGVAPW